MANGPPCRVYTDLQVWGEVKWEADVYLLCVAGTLVAVTAVRGSTARLPCRITSRNPHDPVLLVLWYRNASVTPTYRFVNTLAVHPTSLYLYIAHVQPQTGFPIFLLFSISYLFFLGFCNNESMLLGRKSSIIFCPQMWFWILAVLVYTFSGLHYVKEFFFLLNSSSTEGPQQVVYSTVC